MIVPAATLLALASLGPAAAPAERAVHAEAVVAAPRAEVWQTLTTTEGVTSFFAPRARVELRHGGPYEVHFLPDAEYGSRGSEGCVITAYVPEELLAFTWSAPPSFGAIRASRTFVVIRLDDAGEGRTRVRLANGGYGSGMAWDAVYTYFEQAWPRVLANLQRRFERGPIFADDQRGAAEVPEWRHYVYYLHPARADFFTTGPTPEELMPLQNHVHYVKDLVARGRAILAGPSEDPPIYPTVESAIPLEMRAPGIVVFRAVDDEEARRILEGDPAVRAGVFMGRANPFTLSFREP